MPAFSADPARARPRRRDRGGSPRRAGVDRHPAGNDCSQSESPRRCAGPFWRSQNNDCRLIPGRKNPGSTIHPRTPGRPCFVERGFDSKAELAVLIADYRRRAPIEEIRVEEGFNARTTQDETALRRLADSIARDGVIEPLRVAVAEGGKARLIAGHRRLAAARLAGLKQVPVVHYGGERPRQVSLVENFHREDLDLIDAARGLKAITEELGLNKSQLAEQVDMSVTWVSERLRLLDLPEGAQELVAAGVVPVEAERVLRKVAAVSPRVAECVCVMARRRDVAPSEFLRVFDQLLRLTCEGRFTEKPTMIDVRRVTVGKVIADRTEREELVERVNGLNPYLVSEDPQVRLGEPEADAARAAGCLIEHEVDNGDFVSVSAYITDPEMAADLLRRAVDRKEAEVKRRAEEEAAWRSRNGQLTGTPDEQKEQRRTQREQAKADAAAARKFNDELGRNLISRRGKGTRREHGLARAKAIAAVLLADNPDLAAAGLRLVLSQLQEVEVKHLKSGARREKVSYGDREQCLAYLTLANRIEEARTEAEVNELLADALIAGLLADQAELPRTNRVPLGLRADAEVAKLLAAGIKAVKPDRRAKKA
ncbi:MAG TPA: ParB/RepB/Spo0J family partition protein [Solirubrobacterales bacterium]|nr:ParB/RepB/Spo0J family partition protein [Solirubrobacterales bacterium]